MYAVTKSVKRQSLFGAIHKLSRAPTKKYIKTIKIDLRKNMHAVETRNHYWSKEDVGRTRITSKE